MNPRKYDWPELFSRPGFKLRRGEDYRCSQASMVQQIRNAATHVNSDLPEEDKLRLRVVDGGDWVQVIVERREPCRS